MRSDSSQIISGVTISALNTDTNNETSARPRQRRRICTGRSCAAGDDSNEVTLGTSPSALPMSTAPIQFIADAVVEVMVVANESLP